MSRHIVTINHNSLQDTMKFNERVLKDTIEHGGCGECQTSCQSACKTSCTIGNLACTEQQQEEE